VDSGIKLLKKMISGKRFEFEILRNKKPEILRLRVLIFQYTVVL